ncbi:MAG: metallophosphoesterase [Gemmatimonadota bacterium]
MRDGLVVALVGSFLLGACQPHAQPTPPPAEAPAALVALAGASIMIAVGDIGNCSTNGDELTAGLVDSVLKADSAAKVEDAVLTLGDNAYPGGSARDFARCFAPSWGDTNRRIMKRIHPSPGNHEHLSGMAAPYYEYFGNRAGSSKKGYYSYNLGEWHFISLNSEMIVNSGFTIEERNAQLDWLDADLKANANKVCTLAYWHNPRWSSGWHGSDPRIDILWQRLYNAGVDVILNGHDHEYERFLPQSPAGTLDSIKGIVQFVVGTGGGGLRGFTRKVAASDFRLEGYYGVLKLTLGASEFQWAFLDTSGHIWDPGAGKCH